MTTHRQVAARCCLVAASAFSFGCCSWFRHSERVAAPDSLSFTRVVPFPELRDAYAHGTLAPGMPVSVLAQVFPEEQHRVPVASVGSRQELEQAEGMTGDAVDPSIKVWMQEHRTERGTVRAWYRYQDFHRMEIETGDIVTLYRADDTATAGEPTIDTVQYIEHDHKLMLTHPVAFAPTDTLTMSIKLHHDARQTTWWYRRVRCNGARMTLLDDNPAYYPLLQFEVNGEKSTPFSWR